MNQRVENGVTTLLAMLVMASIFVIGILIGVMSHSHMTANKNAVANVRIKEEIDGIYNLIAAGNDTKQQILGTQFRLYHYIAGHDKPIQGCDECGLIKELEYRKEYYQKKK